MLLWPNILLPLLLPRTTATLARVRTRHGHAGTRRHVALTLRMYMSSPPKLLSLLPFGRSQFFITLDRTDDLNRKHTIFGKVRCPSLRASWTPPSL